MKKICTYSKELNGYANELLTEFEELCKEESNADIAISDILHYIEFNNFNASEGYKLANMIKQYQNKRRKIKCEKQQVEILLNNTIKSFADDHILNRINNVEATSYCNANYKPKILFDLFKNGVK